MYKRQITDEARAYRAEGKSDAASGSIVNVEMQHENNSRQITLKMSNTAQDQDAMLGYEIYRNGTVIGFAEAHNGVTEYTDTIATVNNRVFTYEVVAYDKLLNITDKAVLNPIKISHDGSAVSYTHLFNIHLEDEKTRIANPHPLARLGIPPGWRAFLPIG